MGFEIVGLDHVQLGQAPKGGEDVARGPSTWGCSGSNQSPSRRRWAAARSRLLVPEGRHCGAPGRGGEDLRPARKAHPAFSVRDLPALQAALGAAGVVVRPNPDLGPGRCLHRRPVWEPY